MEPVQKVTVREIADGDVEKVRWLEEISFPDPWSAEGIRESMRQDYTRLFGAWHGEMLVGYAIIYFTIDEGELVRIAVEPSFRRAGVASLLLGEFFRISREAGKKRALLDVRESNEAAIKLYTKAGFETDGRRKNFYAKPEEAAVLMSRELGK